MTKIWSTISCDPDNSGNGYQASYDNTNKCVTIRRVFWPDQFVEIDKQALRHAMKLFPDNGFNLGERVLYTVPACAEYGMPEFTKKAIITAVRKTTVEKLIINTTGMQEKQFNETRVYDIQPDDDEYIHTNCPEQWLKSCID